MKLTSTSSASMKSENKTDMTIAKAADNFQFCRNPNYVVRISTWCLASNSHRHSLIFELVLIIVQVLGFIVIELPVVALIAGTALKHAHGCCLALLHICCPYVRLRSTPILNKSDHKLLLRHVVVPQMVLDILKQLLQYMERQHPHITHSFIIIDIKFRVELVLMCQCDVFSRCHFVITIKNNLQIM